MEKPTSLHQLATKLADSALVAGYLSDMWKRSPKSKPGAFIKSRSLEEREQIKKLKAEHFNDRIDCI